MSNVDVFFFLPEETLRWSWMYVDHSVSVISSSLLQSQHRHLLQQISSLSQLKHGTHAQSFWCFAPQSLHGRFPIISLSSIPFFTQHSDLGHETQSGWGWSGSPGSPKAGSSLVTSKRGEAVRPNEPPDWRRGRSGVKVTFLCVFPTWIFKPI